MGHRPAGQAHPLDLLATDDGAGVEGSLVQIRQTQTALDQAQALVSGQVEQALDTPAELNGGVTEQLLAPSLAAG